MIYGYARVSTTKQASNGNSLTDQEKALRAAGAEQIVSDAFTGTKMDRPAFTNLVETLKDGDTLIVTKLDRFARTVVEGVSVIRNLIERGVTVRILNMGTVENTPTGKVTLTVMMAFAEFERDMIVERTQTGKAIARANGKRVDGRPKKFPKKYIEEALKRIEEGESYNDVADDTKISKSTLIRAMKERRANDDGTQYSIKTEVTKVEPTPVKIVMKHEEPKEPTPVKIVLVGEPQKQEPSEPVELKFVNHNNPSKYDILKKGHTVYQWTRKESNIEQNESE